MIALVVQEYDETAELQGGSRAETRGECWLLASPQRAASRERRRVSHDRAPLSSVWCNTGPIWRCQCSVAGLVELVRGGPESGHRLAHTTLVGEKEFP